MTAGRAAGGRAIGRAGAIGRASAIRSGARRLIVSHAAAKPPHQGGVHQHIKAVEVPGAFIGRQDRLQPGLIFRRERAVAGAEANSIAPL